MLTKIKIAAVALFATTASYAQSVEKTQKVGSGLYELVYNQKDNSVYVASAGSRTKPHGFVVKLDANTLAVKDSISLADNPPYGIGINNKTQKLYTTNTRNNSVSVIDLKTNKVLATIKPSFERSHTREVVADEVNNKVYVSDVGGGSKIWVIDGKTDKLEKVIENTGKSTTGMVVDAEKGKLYYTNMGTNNICVLDLKSHAVVDSFSTGGESSINLVLDKKTQKLFVANQKSNNVTVVDLKTKQVVKTIEAGKGALGIALDPVKRRVYTANRQDGTITAINADTYEVVSTLKTEGTFPNTITIDPKTGSLYVTNKAQGKRDEPTFVDPNGDVVSKIKI